MLGKKEAMFPMYNLASVLIPLQSNHAAILGLFEDLIQEIILQFFLDNL